MGSEYRMREGRVHWWLWRTRRPTRSANCEQIGVLRARRDDRSQPLAALHLVHRPRVPVHSGLCCIDV